MTNIDPEKLMRLREEMVKTERAAEAARERLHETELARCNAERAFLDYARYGDEGPKTGPRIMQAGLANQAGIERGARW